MKSYGMEIKIRDDQHSTFSSGLSFRVQVLSTFRLSNVSDKIQILHTYWLIFSDANLLILTAFSPHKNQLLGDLF